MKCPTDVLNVSLSRGVIVIYVELEAGVNLLCAMSLLLADVKLFSMQTRMQQETVQYLTHNLTESVFLGDSVFASQKKIIMQRILPSAR